MRWGLGIVVVVVVAVGAVVLVNRSGGDEDDGGVVLVPAAAVREGAFFESSEADVEGVSGEEPGGEGFEPLEEPVAVAAVSVKGSVEGLYTAQRDQSLCDVERAAEVLVEESAAADAWFAALGRHVDREDYVDDLTAVQLRYDTRVDGHDLDDGEPRRFPAVLQAGTAVLVDRFGVPRMRCAGGMPLANPESASDADADADAAEPANPDEAWDGFDPARVVVVDVGPEVDTFDLHDAATGELFARRLGSNGDRDNDHRPEEPQLPGCEECHKLDVTMALPDGVKAQIQRMTGTMPESRATEDGLHWSTGQAPPGLYRLEVANLYYVHHYIEDEAELGNWFTFDDPRYEDEEISLGSPDVSQGANPGLGELQICVPGDITVTVAVDDVVTQTFTDHLSCVGDTSSKIYELTI